MFKFARYFFIVFVLTTLIPLILLFLWNFHQIEEFRKEKKQHINLITTKQLQHNIDQYLISPKKEIENIINNTDMNNISLSKLKELTEADEIQQINDYQDSNNSKRIIKAYYEISDNSLATVFVIPLKNSAYKVIKKIDPAKLHPGGPIWLEIYKDNDFKNDSLIASIDPPFLYVRNNKSGQNKFFKCFDDNKPFMRSNNKMDSEIIELKGFKEETVASILLKVILPNNPGSFLMFKLTEPGYLILLMGLALSVLVGFYVNNNFVKPLLAISEGTKKIKQGNFSFRLQTKSKQDEINETFENFNQMINDLKEKEELRNNFIVNLTHDLKTPITSQEKALNLLSKEFESLGMEDAYKLAQGIEKNSKHLLRMVNLILESYQFDDKNLKINPQVINIYELINNCFEKLKTLDPGKNIEFINDIPQDFPLINFDLISLKRVFLNLISNAIENVDRNGQIKITLESEKDFINMFIEDNGFGIADEDLPHLFDRYYTGKSDERKIGSGLGLYVCKKLLNSNNSDISVESKINEYTKFKIKFPKNIVVTEGNKNK